MHLSLRDIIKEGISESASEEQKREFHTLFHQTGLEYELKNQLLDNLTEFECPLKDQPYFDRLFDRFWSRRVKGTPELPVISRLAIGFARIAAVLVVGLLLGHYISFFPEKKTPEYYTSIAPKGSISELYLTDGTHVFLNSNSKIRFTNEGQTGNREIYLDGEAWFQVAKMKKKPFLVHTSLYDIKVTGTSFNVKAYPEEKDVITTLEEGSVHITSSDKMELKGETILKPGEQFVYNKESKRIQLAEVNTRQYTSWKENKLIFINMSLRELKTLLERKFGVDITIEAQEILEYHYDGTIKNETIIEVLDILKLSLPINYQIIGQQIIITKK